MKMPYENITMTNTTEWFLKGLMISTKLEYTSSTSTAENMMIDDILEFISYGRHTHIAYIFMSNEKLETGRNF